MVTKRPDPRARADCLPRHSSYNLVGVQTLGPLCAPSSSLKASIDSSVGLYAGSSRTSGARGLLGGHCSRRASRTEHPGEREHPHPTLLQAPHCIPLVPSPLMSLSRSSHALPLGRRHPPQPCTHKGSAGFREKEGSSQIVRILFLLSTPPCWQQGQGPGHGEAKVMVMERLPWFCFVFFLTRCL